jgi:hypothetical protein
MSHRQDILALIERVRRRWRAARLFEAVVRTALSVTLIIGIVAIASRWTSGSPVALAAAGVAALLLIGAGAIWAALPLRARPTDRQVARFIEEREPSLDDRLVSAVDLTDHAAPAGLAQAMLADAARRVSDVSVERILSSEALRRAGFRATAAALVLLAAAFSARHVARQTADAVALTLFPARVALEVTPGNARIKAGTPLAIQARLVGNTAPVAAQVQVANGEGWRAADMVTAQPGAFGLRLESVVASFRYRVVAGAVASPIYDVTVVHPPRVARIDVDYQYPAGLNLKPRTERDSGDIYAPAGTAVRLHIVTDRPAASGRLTLASGQPIDLAASGANEMSAAMRVTDDNSYRLALADGEGLGSQGDTEYFIRVLEDRPPDVRVLKPASDRAVTSLEEIDIDAQAEDDYGVDRLDLVYAVRGGDETVVPLKIPRAETTVTGHHTLFLEDLDVRPGDFISYYVRARDLTRGTRPNEARSDIFFLEVKPYEQEFALAQSQSSAAGGGGRGSIDDLVTAQKEVIVATWKLDRRAQSAKGRSEADIKSVAKAESELRTRVEQTSSGFRENTMRDPRRRAQPQRGRGGATPSPQPEPLRAGQTMPEEDAMTAAAGAMGRAVASLEALKTADARAPEMEALDYLLKAQAEVKKREVQRQQAGNGAGSNRSNYDLSTLFDKELQKQQQTNYETRSTAEQKGDASQSALDKVRELARRQDELLKKQQELAKNRAAMSEEELRRELEKLTREQSDLRQQAEELASQQASKDSQGSSGSSASKGSSGSSSSRMKDAADAMRSAANDLRRQDPGQASASGARALERLRDLERRLQSGQPDERRRALGDMQLEARQLADAQRDVASELRKADPGEAGKDAVRKLASEEERLSERARRLQDALARQDGGAEAGKDIDRQRLSERMRQSADAMRAAADRGPGTQRGSTAPAASSPAVDEARRQAAAQDDLARALDKAADKLASASGVPKDAEAGKLSGQLARARELHDRLDALSNEMQRLGDQGRAGGAAPNGQGGGRGQGRGDQPSSSSGRGGDSGRPGQGQAGGGGSATDAARLRDEVQRALQETRELMDQLKRDDPALQTFTRGGGAGFTFEGQGLSASAPGTEAFKQDFAKWDDLRRQLSGALEQAQTTLSKKLQAKESKNRLAAGADDKAPLEYRQQVDEYFKAIAGKKKGS